MRQKANLNANYAVSMRFSKQKRLKKLMDIAHCFVTACLQGAGTLCARTMRALCSRQESGRRPQ
jgi:hypothetical protein